MPPIGLLLVGVDFADLFLLLKQGNPDCKTNIALAATRCPNCTSQLQAA